MRNTILAILALAPVLVHAQAQSPAQPRGAQAAVLESKLVSPQPVEGAASPNVGRASALVQPKLIKWSDVEVDQGRSMILPGHEASFTVSMTVTAEGVPTHLKIVDSDNPPMNRNVLDAVAGYRFTRPSVDSRPTPMPLILTVHVLKQ
jgi:hypothetical protein